MTAVRLPRPGDERSAGRSADPRLAAWRDLLVTAATDVLRRYHSAWGETHLDDAGRAAAGVGVGASVPEMRALPSDGEFARIVAAARLDRVREAVLAAPFWSAVDPQFAVLLGCVHDDSTRRHATLGLLAVLLGPDVPLNIGDHDPLVAAGLLDAVPDAATPLRLPAVTAALLAGTTPPAAHALPSPPARLAPAVERAARLVELGGSVLVRCVVPEDRAVVRTAVAARLALAVPTEPRPPRAAALLLDLGRELPSAVLDTAADLPVGCVLACGGPGVAVPPGWHVLDVPAAAVESAALTWRHELAGAGITVRSGELTELAGRMPLAEASIAQIVRRATVAARAAGRDPGAADVRAVLRAHPRHDLAGLAHRLPAELTFEDLIFGPHTAAGLRALLAHARHSALAHARMGLGGTRGRAVIGLFHGPSGTGKTAAAEALAAELDRDLWVVDLSRVVSKWLGETQRNLDTVLAEAAASGAVLLFDEADGLFGRRGEVSDARDRYANLEIDHLLQRIELHAGVVVLTSNRPSSIDEAFARRVRVAIRFDPPEHAQREQLWARYVPAGLLDDGVTTDEVARQELTGAGIRSAALGAVVAALDDGGPVRDVHLHAAVARELDKSKRPRTTRGMQP